MAHHNWVKAAGMYGQTTHTHTYQAQRPHHHHHHSFVQLQLCCRDEYAQCKLCFFTDSTAQFLGEVLVMPVIVCGDENYGGSAVAGVHQVVDVPVVRVTF